jgi:hypothetical protein
MERVIFLIEDTHERISCMLNPEEGKGRFEGSSEEGGEDEGGGLLVRRVSGVSPDKLSPSTGSDNTLIPDGQGQTSLELSLLFDVTLPGSTSMPKDVRDLTRPLWKLTEHITGPTGERRLRRARFIWGKAWNIPVVVESLSERYERFTPDGTPQRSWMRIRLLRAGEEIRLPARSPVRLESLPGVEALAAAANDLSWGVHEKTGGEVAGESLPALAYRYYGDPGLWRLIARANNITNPLRILTGTLLQIPPLSVLKRSK